MTKESLSLSVFLTKALAHASDGQGLASLILNISEAIKQIARLTAQGALGSTNAKLESRNVQGETQMVLDVLSNELMLNAITQSEQVAGVVSEEMQQVHPILHHRDAKFLVNFDPLDGSSNVAVNVSVGTIFSILPAPISGLPLDSSAEAAFLQAGTQQLAAGYALYGPATLLVITVGNGTYEFTLDADTHTFVLSRERIQIPAQCNEFSINSSNERFWESSVQHYIEDCKAGTSGRRGLDFNMRWVGSMVADVHRILTRGGVYLYPKDNKQPARAGRLRILYEINPISMLVEQAGGRSSTGHQQSMEIIPTHIHQRGPVILGSHDEVELIEQYYMNDRMND